MAKKTKTRKQVGLPPTKSRVKQPLPQNPKTETEVKSKQNSHWLDDQDLTLQQDLTVYKRTIFGKEEELHWRPEYVVEFVAAQRKLCQKMYPNVPVDKLSPAKFQVLMEDFGVFWQAMGERMQGIAPSPDDH